MTETYEDIFQANIHKESSLPTIFGDVYNYIPRLGEFYQRIAVHFMTFQTSFGMDMLFRLLNVAMATGTIYLSTVFVLGRRPKLKYKDVALFLGIVLIMMFSAFSEIFTYRFSYANNYVLALLVTLGFLVPFRLKSSGDKWWKLVGIVLLGFAFGISTEVAPIAFLIILGLWIVGKLIKKEIKFSDFFGKYRLQTFAVIGLLAGLFFFYCLGSGLGTRTSQGYAEVYDYVSPTGILHDPVTTIYKLVQHIWYNVRYIFFAIILMSMYLFVEWTVFKKERKEYFDWQRRLFVFCVLFVGATCLISVHDDLYPRFMIFVFVAIMLSIFMFIRHIIEYAKVPEKTMRRTAVVTIGLSVVMIADVAFAFTLYNRQMAEKLPAIHYNPGAELVVDHIEGPTKMIPSPVFNLRQLTPFDWGPSLDYMKYGLGIKKL